MAALDDISKTMEDIANGTGDINASSIGSNPAIKNFKKAL